MRLKSISKDYISVQIQKVNHTFGAKLICALVSVWVREGLELEKLSL